MLQEEGVPTRAPRVELELQGFSLRIDTFPPGGAHVRRTTLSIGFAELRDCKPSPDTAPAWRRIMSQHLLPRSPHDATACMLEVSRILECVHCFVCLLFYLGAVEGESRQG